MGIKDGFKVSLFHQPYYYFRLFTDFPTEVKIVNKSKVDFIHYFDKEEKQLLKDQIEQNGNIWKYLPKRLLKFETNITEDVIRSIT